MMARLPFGDMVRATLQDDHPPLYTMILFATTRLLGDSQAALRLPSAVLGIANIYMIYRLGTVLWDRLTGVFAAALLAFASFHIWRSQEARMYPLLCLAATAFALATVVFLSRPSRLRASLCGLTGLALLYSHPYGVLNWGAINLAAGLALYGGSAWKAAPRRAWLAVQGLVILAFLPWVFALLSRISVVLEEDLWIQFPTPHALYSISTAVVGGTAMLLVLLALVLVALVGSPSDDRATGARTATPFWSRIGRGIEWQNWLLLSWVTLPFLGAYALSVAVQPILQDRYLIGSLPPLLLLAARGLWTLRFNRIVLAGAIAALVVCSVPAVYKSVAVDQNEDGRAAVSAFSQNFRPSDAVVMSSPGVSNVFSYYFRAPMRFETIVYHPQSDPVEWPGVSRVWVFVRDGITQQTAPVLARMAALYQLQQAFHFYRFSLYLYARAETADAARPDSGHAQASPSRLWDEGSGIASVHAPMLPQGEH